MGSLLLQQSGSVDLGAHVSVQIRLMGVVVRQNSVHLG